MKISEMIKYQKEFDLKHSSKGKIWSQSINNDNIEVLEHLLVCAMGELGETANIVKKISRGDFILKDQKESLELEITDLFIYVLKMIYQLDINIEERYIEKMTINKERFKEYE